MSDDYVKKQSERFSNRARSTAEGLRKIADDVERRSKVKPDIRTMIPDHAKAAEEVIHTIHWGIANLNIDGLVRAAADADRAPQVQQEIDTAER